MSEYEIQSIPSVAVMAKPPTLGDTDNFDQDAEAYLYSQRQAFLDLNATIAVLNPVAAAIMQQAQAVASNTDSVQQLAAQVSQQANQVSQDVATVNQQTQTVADLRQQVAEDLATAQEHVSTAQQQAELAEQAAQLAIQVTEFDPNDYYSKTESDQVLAQKAQASHNHSASEITSGTLDGDRLPNPSSTNKGAIKIRVNGTTAYITTNGATA